MVRKRQVGHQYDVEAQGKNLLIRTNGSKKYLNYRLCRVSTENPEAEWIEILPYDPLTEITEVLPFSDFIVLAVRTDGMVKLDVILAKNGIPSAEPGTHFMIDLSEKLYNAYLNGHNEQNYESSVLRFSYSTPISDKKVLEYDVKARKAKVLKETVIPGDFDPLKYTLERVYAPINEENRVKAPYDTPVPESVPISVFYRTDLFKKDGSNPCYLYGYGSYGISIDCSFSSSRISLLDRGYVYCIAHIRGGGDNGRGWYETGKFKNKRNTFIDFNSAAKTLISKGYASSKLLVIDGRSAGGLLIGATLNMEPEIYAVAVLGVPFVDVINTMMDETIPLTINEYEEWGNPNEKDFFDYMLSYSPYDNIPKGKKFPDLLIKAGLFDPRVAYWEPAKYLAKLRDWKMDRNGDSDASPSVFVMSCLMSSGHFGSTGRYAYLKEIASDFAFVIDRINNKLEK